MDDMRLRQLLALLAQVLSALPWLLVMLAGGVVCLRRLSTNPREGWLVGGAIALSLFATFGVPNAINLLLQFIPGLMDSVMAGANYAWKFQLLYGLPTSLFQAAAWGLILYAAFGEGSGPRSKYLIEDEQSEQKSA